MKLPRSVVRDLNRLGFVLTAEQPPLSFVRMALGSELWLRIEPLSSGRWRVSLAYREPADWGKIPNPVVPVSLGRHSGDGTLELETTALVEDLVSLLERCILPTVDLAPS